MTDKQLADLYKGLYEWAQGLNVAYEEVIRALCDNDPDRARAALRPYVRDPGNAR